MTGTGRGALAVGLIAALSACQPPANQSANAVEAVRAADIAWAQAFSRKDLAGYLAFVDSTASLKAAARQLQTRWLGRAAPTSSWTPPLEEANRS